MSTGFPYSAFYDLYARLAEDIEIHLGAHLRLIERQGAWRLQQRLAEIAQLLTADDGKMIPVDDMINGGLRTTSGWCHRYLDAGTDKLQMSRSTEAAV